MYLSKNNRTKGLRWAAVALTLVGALGAWQLIPSSEARASAPVDQTIVTPSGSPASFADVISAVKPAVVNISTSMNAAQRFGNRAPDMPFSPGSPFEDFLRRFFEQQSYRAAQGRAQVVEGMGSGFVVAPDGYVVTNHHVVKGADEIAVTLDDGTKHDAELIGTDPKTDLALLKIETEGPLPYARFGESDTTRVGDWVIAIGNPFGLGGTATTGIVSARGRDIQSGPFDDFLQIDAPINRGNSGGPLFNLSGQVVGINTAIFSPNGGNVGIGFAIPAQQAAPIIEQLRTTGRVDRGWLGVQIQAVTEDIAEGLGLESEHGALVAGVEPGSPAERAGFRSGDVIVGFEGERILRVKDLTRKVAETGSKSEVQVEVWRSGSKETLDVVLGSSPEPTARASVSGRAQPGESSSKELGLAMAELTPESRQRFRVPDELDGALIVGVEPGSPAADRGLAPGDVVTMVGQSPVTGPNDATQKIDEAKSQSRESVLLQVARGGNKRFIAIPFKG
jgi:serine protease Do